MLKGSIQHRDPSGYVNIELFGSQITLKSNMDVIPNLPDFHFGINLGLDKFDGLAKNILETAHASIIMAPEVVDAGTPMERKKMYLKCPTGYLIEIKGYKSKHYCPVRSLA